MSVPGTHVRHSLPKWIFAAIASLLLLSACGGSNTQVQSTPTAALPTNSASTQVVQFGLGIPQQALQSPTVGNVPGNTSMHVIVTFKPNDPLLNRLGTQTTSSTQPTDGSTLANQLGITDQQYQEVKSFFGIQGVTLNLNKLHTTLALDAPASTFEKLLHTTFVYHQYQGRKFFAPSSAILIPQLIVDHIQAITGLDNYSRPPAKKSLISNLQPLNASQIGVNNCTDTVNTNGPQQVAGAYNFGPLYAQGWQGQGTTIILPEFETFSQSDLQQYMSCVHFHGKISVVTVNNNPPQSEGGEALLDLEMVTGLLPAANIVVYQEDPASDFSKFWVAFDDVLAQIGADYTKLSGPTEVSLSWGGAEDFLTVGLVNALDTQMRILTQVDHINVFAASGDCGAYDSINYPSLLDADFPGTDRSVIAVGGTNLVVRNNTRGSEIVWSGNPKNPADCRNTWGSGGGLSQAFDLPAWQQAPGVQNKYSNGRRQVPDVAAVAWTVAYFAHGRWGWNGGTSAAAPIWASAYALVNEGLVAKTQHFVVGGAGIFYWLAQNQANQHPFFDVVQGNNLYYPAGPGWDFATGLGTPNLVGMFNGLARFIQNGA